MVDNIINWDNFFSADEPTIQEIEQFLMNDDDVGLADHSPSGLHIGFSDDHRKDKEKVSQLNNQDPVDKKGKSALQAMDLWCGFLSLYVLQLRNRDAAVRSRERKKLYVRDLELKSRYFESECKRLGFVLQCCLAENQALHFSLQNSSANGVSMTKQESAVLLIPAVGFPALVPGHHMPAHSTQPNLVKSRRKSGKQKPRASGSNKGRK
ncbi:hypothetical protein RND71_027263 [Anisodus tanguticus]|uniref:Uncharacterized protein n=1 Tax=Anisodus tanguticus TaxID=243964 RepID=A0AAE1V8V5_9SOLA|nr:hypothetical protein RND71_027263 [Anisodus tanguticus]